MRSSILLLFTIICGTLSSSQPAVEIVGGKIFNFGTLLTNRVVTKELTLRNRGTDTLKIWDVSGSCGCTGTLLSNDHLLPGEEGILKITFDPEKLSGPVEKMISMKTNDPVDPNPHIAFHADVRHILEFDREYLVFQTRPDSAAVSVLRIMNTSDKPVAILDVTGGAPELTTEISRKVIPPGAEATLTCRMLTGKAGILKGDLTIRTDHELIPTLSLRYFSYSKTRTTLKRSGTGK